MNTYDTLLRSQKYSPRWGWHDDHAAADGTPNYLPAVMQVRAEFEAIIKASTKFDSCLQLGIGPCVASHDLWRLYFDRVVSIDLGRVLIDDLPPEIGADTHDVRAVALAESYAPYDLLFIDAGHSYNDVRADYATYARLVRPGGIIAFHDALPRSAYPEVQVHRFLAELSGLTIVGDKVGTAYMSAGG
jgi:hypothetical protein